MVSVVWRGADLARRLGLIARSSPRFFMVIGSTRTSTIPGISIAGATPQATLLTPALDAEYLVMGRALSMDVIPVTPDGIPTPAVVSRAVVRASTIPVLVVDAGSYVVPKIPHARLPHRVVGGVIGEGRALPEGAARQLFEDAYALGNTSLGPGDAAIIGESIPGGTTQALAILAGLGYDAWGKVSSASPSNPVRLKESLVRKAIRLCSSEGDPWGILSCLGDPVHPSAAGLAAGAADAGASVVLAGGTQMAAVLAIMRLASADTSRAVVGTTRWLVQDRSSDIVGLVREVSPDVPVLAYEYDFSKAPYEGLRRYEEGYVKEGVGMGGLGVVAALAKGLSREEVHEAIYREYGRLVRRD